MNENRSILSAVPIVLTAGFTVAGGVAMAMSLGACGLSGDHAVDESARESTGGVELEPNTIVGHVRFTNQNPEILALLDSDSRKNAFASASSTSPTGYSARTPRMIPNSLREFEFELSVESAAGGPAGVAYDVKAVWSNGGALHGSWRTYTFQPVTAQVLPPALQSTPTKVDIEECIGVLRLQWGEDDTCATPLEMNTSYMYWRDGTSGQARKVGTDQYYYVRGGDSGVATLQYTTGSDIYSDLNTHRRNLSWSAACDEVVTICTPMPEATELGAARGPYQVVGEESTRWRRALSNWGPDANYRYTWANIEAPVSEPDSWWTLPNMIPGNYGLRGNGWLRRGHEHVYYVTPALRSLAIEAGQTVRPTLSVDGAERDALVMHPAYMHGAVRLVDPYVVSQPGADSSLEALFFEADFDSNGDGIQDYNFFYSYPRFATALRAYARNYEGHPHTSSGTSYTSFAGRFELGAGMLSSSYEHVFPNLYDLPASWYQHSLRLGFWSVGTSKFYTRPGEYDPVRFRHGYLDLVQHINRAAVLGPGDTHRVDHEYCFNEVQLQYTTDDGVFYNPTARVSGSFKDVDWRGQDAHYSASGLFTGIPAVFGVPQAEAVTYAASSGSIRFTVPQGAYTITPGATMVHEDGTVNDATFRPVQIALGCGQRLKLVPPLSVAVNPAPTCADSAQTTLTGTVTSDPAEVDRIWYRHNDGPEVTLCTNCGMDPTFSFPLALAACENTVEVFAFSAGMPEPASGFVQVVWDDPSDGPSCTDSTCVNQPPVARCDNLVVPANDQCTGDGSIAGDSYDPDGDDIVCVESETGPYELGRTRITLTCTDSQGATDSCEGTITVVDRMAPEIECPAGPVLECTDGGADAQYAVQASDRCSPVTTTCTPVSGSWFGLGVSEVECVARDESNNTASCTHTVTVEDTTAPSITCPDTVVAECSASGATEITPLDAEISDACQAAEVVSAPVSGVYPVGITEVEYVAEDADGNQSSCTSNIVVTDSAAPSVEVASTVELWPPDHSMRVIDIPRECGVAVTDVCSGGPDEHVSVAITCVTSDEPASGGGPAGADIEWLDDTHVRVRAERSGKRDGRVYRVHFEATDAAGNHTPSVCEIHVPHDRSGSVAVDSGPAYEVCR